MIFLLHIWQRKEKETQGGGCDSAQTQRQQQLSWNLKIVFFSSGSFTFFFFFFFKGWQVQHTEVPRLGVELEPKLAAYATATAMPDLSCIFYLRHNLWQCQILYPLSEARDQTWILRDTNRLHFTWATLGTPSYSLQHHTYLQGSIRQREEEREKKRDSQLWRLREGSIYISSRE